MVKNPPAYARDLRDRGLILGSERSPGGGHGNPLQYSCQENPIDRAAWRATVQRVAKSRKGLKQPSMHACGCWQPVNHKGIMEVPKILNLRTGKTSVPLKEREYLPRNDKVCF